MDLLNIAPAYPLTETEKWRVLQMESESGLEQRIARWSYPKRSWDLKWVGTNYSEVTSVREFVRHVYGGATSFFWKEPYQTSRNRVFLGWGDGSRTSWLVPVSSATAVVYHVNSTIVSPSISQGTGQHGLDVATFATPASGAPIDIDYTDGYYYPIVRVVDQFKFTLQAPLVYGEMSFSITETKEEYPTG